MTTQRLYRLADARQIPVFFLPLPECGSISLQDARGRCAIGMDSGCAAQASERVHLAHELGHCLTGSFYNCQRGSRQVLPESARLCPYFPVVAAWR